ncbi:tetratricopeptide repeat protein [Corynebacterium anserum]|uniref:Tetratricopeptide repeat protein n=1 Tax=Corynebacterium anserum TaxID=2684406 RepID=A0A7G7YN72_9CORY|nr:tetratricopeptide repeat protein [Corynebacterium anserum]MBC2681484.1 tetratricopeptide repeat protein [Corynebacterium anserum]QNH95942.1 tetratricopeptide repeat protein [Corynebacterium anserum]
MSEHSGSGRRSQNKGFGQRRNFGSSHRSDGGNRDFKGRSNSDRFRTRSKKENGASGSSWKKDGDHRHRHGSRDVRDNNYHYGSRSQRSSWDDRHNNFDGNGGNPARRRNGYDDAGASPSRNRTNSGYSSGDAGSREKRNNKYDARRGDKKKFKHANRGGVNRARHSGPQRSGYREERLNKRLNEPQVPDHIDPRDLDPAVRQELRSLSKDNADKVAKHLIMSVLLLDEDTDKALAHARAAKDRAGRVSVTRETNGIAAYHAGEWKEAISELRAARRMSGGPGMIAVLADCERALGRPEKAIEVGREYDTSTLDPETRIELAIVLSGAHHDLSNNRAALAELEEVLDISDIPEMSRLRLYYAYADSLEIAGRREDATLWFERADELDQGGFMDTEERLASLRKEGE